MLSPLPGCYGPGLRVFAGAVNWPAKSPASGASGAKWVGASACRGPRAVWATSAGRKRPGRASPQGRVIWSGCQPGLHGPEGAKASLTNAGHQASGKPATASCPGCKPRKASTGGHPSSRYDPVDLASSPLICPGRSRGNRAPPPNHAQPQRHSLAHARTPETQAERQRPRHSCGLCGRAS